MFVDWWNKGFGKLFGRNTQHYVWHIIPAVKCSGGSTMIWVCFTASGPGQFAINKGEIHSQVYQGIWQDDVRVAVHQLKLSRVSSSPNFGWFQPHPPCPHLNPSWTLCRFNQLLNLRVHQHWECLVGMFSKDMKEQNYLCIISLSTLCLSALVTWMKIRSDVRNN